MIRAIIIALSLIAISPTSVFAGIVDQAQRMLNQLGYNAGPIDGAYGGRTRAALEQFYTDRSSEFDGQISQNEIVDLSKALNINLVMVDRQPNGLGSRQWGEWNQDMPENDWAFNLTNIVPARSGELSQRFELRNGDCTVKRIPGSNHPYDWGCHNDRERAELMHTQWSPGRDMWIGFSVMIPDEWTVAKRNHCTSIFQIKQTENNVYQGDKPGTKSGDFTGGHYIGGHAVMHGEICGENVGIVIKYTGFTDSKFNGWSKPENITFANIDNLRGKWVDVVLHWDTLNYRKGDSTFEIYLNGEFSGRWENITNNFFPDVYTFKYGLYRGYMKANNGPNFKIGTQVAYYDEVRTGRSFDAVNPATNRPLD